MQLGMISPFGVRCGISTYSHHLCEALQELKVSITGLSENPFPNNESITHDFLPTFPYFNCWQRNLPYDRLIEESKNYDILHCQHQFGLFPIEHAFIKLLHNIKKPLILTLHDVVPPGPQISNYFNEIINNSKKIIVHTSLCRQLLNAWNCPSKKIEVIPHGTKLMDIPHKIDARKELNLPENSTIIMSWGFIWESKGILDLVKIFVEILKTYPEAVFIHAGGVHPIIQGSAYLKKILDTAIKSGLNPKNFIITQWVPENKVPVYMSSADIIVLNYARGSASASGAAHRAMASHRPIVGTDDPCIEDIPKFTVPRFSQNDLYQGILKVLEDKLLQKELVAKADAAAMETSWRTIALKHRNLYALR